MDSTPENNLPFNQRRRSAGRTHRSETFHQVTSEDTHVDQSLESFFARLNVSPLSSRRASDLGLGGGEFDDGSGRFIPLSHGFLQRNNIDELGGLGVTGTGFGSSGFFGLQNHGLDGGVMGSNVDGWDTFVPDSYQPFLLDSRRRAFNNEISRRRAFNNEFSVLPSLNRHGFLGGASPRVPRGVNSSFSNNKNLEPLNFFTMEDLRGKIVALAKDQYGCGFLKEIIDEASSKETIDMIFYEVLERVGELMVNPLASHVVQKLVEKCTEEQRTQILLMITKNEFELVSICINMQGTRAVQKLLHELTNQQQISILMSALSPRAVSLTKEMNGHHVILHCLKNFSDEDNKYLLNQIADNCLGVATDKSGCCVLQQCVEYAKGETKEYLVGEIIANALLLAEDCYGFVVL